MKKIVYEDRFLKDIVFVGKNYLVCDIIVF